MELVLSVLVVTVVIALFFISISGRKDKID